MLRETRAVQTVALNTILDHIQICVFKGIPTRIFSISFVLLVFYFPSLNAEGNQIYVLGSARVCVGVYAPQRADCSHKYSRFSSTGPLSLSAFDETATHYGNENKTSKAFLSFWFFYVDCVGKYK